MRLSGLLPGVTPHSGVCVPERVVAIWKVISAKKRAVAQRALVDKKALFLQRAVAKRAPFL